MNKVVLIGRLVADPEARTTNSGIAAARFRLAVNRRYTDKTTGKREADYIDVVCWRNTAEVVAKYLAKGRRVGVFGAIQTRSYDAQDGTKRYVTEVVADEVEFLSEAKREEVPMPDEPPMGDGFTEVQDDELPF